MVYDCLIIGCGPSGMTAAIYLKRAGKKVAILEKGMVGGQVAITAKVQNYTGFKEIGGVELAMSMFEHVQNNKIDVIFEEVISCNLLEDIKEIQTYNNTYQAKTVLIATGAFARNLKVDGELQFKNKGVSYCATCDGSLYKNKNVVVVGGGNSSFDDCFYLVNIAKSVTLIHRREQFRGDEESLQKLEALEKDGKINILRNCVVEKIDGNDFVESVKVFNKKTEKQTTLQTDGVFIAIGRMPESAIFDGVDVDEFGYIKSNEKMETNIQGVFAAGDVRQKFLRQIVTATSDGAVASAVIGAYLQEHKM